MFEGMAGQCGVIGLDIDLHLAHEVVSLQETIDGRHVMVVLVLGRFHRLGLDQDRALEADPVLVFDHEGQEPGGLIQLAPQVGIEQRVVTFPAAPEHIIGAAEPMGRLQNVAHLGGGVQEDLGIGIGGGPGHVAGMAEQVGGPPEQLDARALHMGLDMLQNGIEHRVAFAQRRAFRRHVAVVEAEERQAQTLHEGEGGIGLGSRGRHRLAMKPGAIDGRGAERIGAVHHETVPVGDGRPQPFHHGPAQHLTVGVIDMVGQFLSGFRPGVTDVRE
jgi:hypothetical protein